MSSNIRNTGENGKINWSSKMEEISTKKHIQDIFKSSNKKDFILKLNKAVASTLVSGINEILNPIFKRTCKNYKTYEESLLFKTGIINEKKKTINIDKLTNFINKEFKEKIKSIKPESKNLSQDISKLINEDNFGLKILSETLKNIVPNTDLVELLNNVITEKNENKIENKKKNEKNENKPLSYMENRKNKIKTEKNDKKREVKLLSYKKHNFQKIKKEIKEKTKLKEKQAKKIDRNKTQNNKNLENTSEIAPKKIEKQDEKLNLRTTLKNIHKTEKTDEKKNQISTKIEDRKTVKFHDFKKKFQESVKQRNEYICSTKNMNDLIDLFNNAIDSANKGLSNRKQIEKIFIKNENMTFSTKSFIKEASEMQRKTKSAFKEAGLDFDKYYLKSLNSSDEWKEYKKDVTLFDKKGIEHKFSCNLTPAKDFKCFDYLKGEQKGVSSADRKTEHAINLWATEVKQGEKVLFQGLRHGNTRGQEKSTKEIILASAVEKCGNVENLLNSNSTKEKPIEINFANVQLLSPSSLKLGYDLKDMPFDQIKTIEKFAKDSPIEIKVSSNGVKKSVFISVKRPLTFNFGSNLQAFNPLLKMFVKSTSKENLESMKSLFGQNFDKHTKSKEITFPTGIIGEYLNKKTVSEADKKTVSEADKKMVKELSKDIISIWKSKSHKNDSSDPYAMSSRVSLLLYKIGYSMTFNCKSGKDRTGIANAEIANLATHYEMNGEFPEAFNKKPSDVECLNLSNLLDGTGANDVTKTCTGVGGLKIVSIKIPKANIKMFNGIEKRFGSVKGVSSAIKMR